MTKLFFWLCWVVSKWLDKWSNYWSFHELFEVMELFLNFKLFYNFYEIPHISWAFKAFKWISSKILDFLISWAFEAFRSFQSFFSIRPFLRASINFSESFLIRILQKFNWKFFSSFFEIFRSISKEPSVLIWGNFLRAFSDFFLNLKSNKIFGRTH